jgi:hypothetical protein
MSKIIHSNYEQLVRCKIKEIDHCLPCVLFDISKEKDKKRCFHWSNTQPMDALDNLSKGDTTNKTEQFLQKIKVEVFLKLYGKDFDEKDYTFIKYNRYKYIRNLDA